MRLVTIFTLVVATFATREALIKDLTVHITTWNVNEKSPPFDLTKLLAQDGKELPDILIIGLQEVTMSPVKALLNAIKSDVWTKTLINRLLKKYVLVKTEATVGIVLNVFVKTKHAWTLEGVGSEVKKMGFGGLYGNKGGVMLTFSLYKQSFCVLNSHFHAHDSGNNDRINDFNALNKVRKDHCSTKADYIFWLGDLNFRIEEASLTEQKIAEIINKGKATDMLKHDQLVKTKKAGKIFDGFNEVPITFNPTYKKLIDNGGYDLTRKPAWTDRILYKSDTSRAITPVFYRSLNNYIISDHFPVQAQFKVSVNIEAY